MSLMQFEDMCVFFSRNLLLKIFYSTWVCLELHAQVRDRFRLLDGPVSIEGYIVLNDPVIDEYCPGIFLEGKSRKLLAGISPCPT